MKKLFYMAIIALLAIAFVSCEKNNEIEQADNNADVIETKTSWGLNRTWDSEKGYCSSPPSNCFDDVDVSGRKSFWQLLFEVLSLPYLYAPPISPEGCNPPELAEYIKAEHIKAVINNELAVSGHVNEKTSTIFLIFSEVETGQTVVVYPFTLNEKE